jgi:hypothetical protein
MGRGHGSGRGVSAKAGGFQGDRSMGHLEAGLQKALKAREDAIRQNDYYEAGTVYDEHGNVVYNEDRGKNGSVYLGSNTADMIVTHNHPLYGKSKGKARADEGGSLSKQDIMLAHDHNEREIRAVTRHYTYSLKRPSEGWHKGGWMGEKFYENPKLSYKKAKAAVDKADKKYWQGYTGNKTEAARRMSATYWHRVNKEFAKRQGYDYSKTRVD